MMKKLKMKVLCNQVKREVGACIKLGGHETHVTSSTQAERLLERRIYSQSSFKPGSAPATTLPLAAGAFNQPTINKIGSIYEQSTTGN